jgi:CHAT domain-containing protein
MAALYDGSQYLLENYTVSTVLSAALTDTQGRLGNADSASALGLGLTQAVPGFSPLPNVAEELRALIRSADNADGGIYPGQIFLDEAFTLEALSQNVRQANILHIATHAEFVPSTQGESYILSGTGQRLALADIGALDTQFRNLHLVVLSACQTALGGATLDGTEIAGLSSYFLGRSKAKTVMATLWKVDDAGTSLLMQRFYTLLATGELTTAEALRQAQLSLLLGETNLDSRLTSLGVNRGGFTLAESEAASVGLSHPYYWAPFILIGNPL